VDEVAPQHGQEIEVDRIIDEIAHGTINSEVKMTDDDNDDLQNHKIVVKASKEASGTSSSVQLRQRNISRSTSSQTVILTDTLSTNCLNEHELQFDLEDLSNSSCTSEMPLLSNPQLFPHVRPRLAIKPSYPTVLSSLLIQLHAPHTAPAIVLTNKIEVYATFAMSYGD
jgi:hypothetical protein